MKRTIDYRKKRIVYVIPEKEFMEKLGIQEGLASVYWSTSTSRVHVICREEKDDRLKGK